MKSKGTKKKGDLGPFFLQWKALEALKACSPYNEKMKMWVKELQAYSLKRGVNSSMKCSL
jgi:hypothetical protein